MRQWILMACLFGVSLTGAAQQFGPKSPSSLQMIDDVALVINNESVTRRQLANEVARERSALPAKLNVPDDVLQQQLVERVITKHLLNQLKQRLGISASDEEIDAAIETVALQNKLPVAQLLKKVRKETGLDTAAYRAQVADTIVDQKLRQGLVRKDISVTPEDIDAQLAQIARQNNVVIALQDLLLPTPKGDVQARGKAFKTQMRQLSDALEKADGDLQKAATLMPEAKFVDLGNVSMGQIPVRFAAAIASQPVGKVIDEPVVDRDGMHFLKVNARQSGDPVIIPEAEVEHILLRAVSNEDAAAQKVLIDELYNRLLQGEDFATLAAKYSQDPVSAAHNGELGWMGADQVEPSFAEMMLKLPLNTYSQPFLSPYGWHIIRVKARRAVDRADDILRANIRERLLNQYLEKAWQKRLIELRQQAYVEFR